MSETSTPPPTLADVVSFQGIKKWKKLSKDRSLARLHQLFWGTSLDKEEEAWRSWQARQRSSNSSESKGGDVPEGEDGDAPESKEGDAPEGEGGDAPKQASPSSPSGASPIYP